MNTTNASSAATAAKSIQTQLSGLRASGEASALAQLGKIKWSDAELAAEADGAADSFHLDSGSPIAEARSVAALREIARRLRAEK